MIDFKNARTIKLSERDEKSANDVLPLLIPGEEIVSVYKSVRDSVVFTTKHIIAVNVQGVTGKKKDFSILPYSKIQAFSVETAGIGDWDSELELWFSGLGTVKLEFSRESNVIEIGQLISKAIL